MVIRMPVRLIFIVLGVLVCLFSWKETDELINAVINYDLPYSVLIIDPGHGGLDGGAVSRNGVKESEINLAISLKLNSLCHLYGISTVLTRDSEVLNYPSDATTISECKKADQNMRLGLIRQCSNAILYSIHQNYYPSEAVSGVQVLYGHDETSRELGCLLQEQLCKTLCSGNRRVASEVEDSIYLLKHCECPAVLIECGFISNQNESELLQSDLYQTKIAFILLSGYIQFISQEQK